MSSPNRPFSSRSATADHRLENAHSTCTTSGLLWVTLLIYVNVIEGVTCCSSVSRASGLFCTPPEKVGSMRSLLTPKNRCKRPATGLAIAEPSSVEAPICCHDCGTALCCTSSEGSEVGVRPVASSATISLNCSGGALRGGQPHLVSAPANRQVVA